MIKMENAYDLLIEIKTDVRYMKAQIEDFKQERVNN